MKLSILIPSYGEDHWAQIARQRALPSALAQGAHEVLIEHDHTGSIASVRNKLGRRASGDYLCFLDADDELDPGFHLAMQRAWQKHQDGSTLFTPAVSQVHGYRRQRPFFFGECDLRTGNWLVIGTLIPRSLFLEIGGFRDFPHGLEDWNLWARCARAGASFVKVQQAIYVAHVSGNSKHHELRKNKAEYLKAYEMARRDAWE
ncbi:MAG: hypothetical protein KatS3mg015_2539 [Fimbriimonadales bacterium]|nr:MAG: hypothetical protein KatS3mg015_2539 [Fimbriimonadales bacterium]